MLDYFMASSLVVILAINIQIFRLHSLLPRFHYQLLAFTRKRFSSYWHLILSGFQCSYLMLDISVPEIISEMLLKFHLHDIIIYFFLKCYSFSYISLFFLNLFYILLCFRMVFFQECFMISFNCSLIFKILSPSSFIFFMLYHYSL